jgi:hypothetical protein
MANKKSAVPQRPQPVEKYQQNPLRKPSDPASAHDIFGIVFLPSGSM